jgi:hypothetical protein
MDFSFINCIKLNSARRMFHFTDFSLTITMLFKLLFLSVILLLRLLFVFSFAACIFVFCLCFRVVSLVDLVDVVLAHKEQIIEFIC